MLNRSILYIALLLLFAGCKKDPQIIHKVLDIKAGDSTSPGVHYVRLNASFDVWPNTDYYLSIDKMNSCDFHFNFYFNSIDPIANTSTFSIEPVSQYSSAYLCVDRSGYPVNFQLGDTINDALNWTDNQRKFVIYYESYDARSGKSIYNYSGNWLKNPVGFIAFKIVDRKTSLTL